MATRNATRTALLSVRGEAASLAQRTATSVAIVSAALECARDPNGDGARVFTQLYEKRSLLEAAAQDQLRSGGTIASAIAGLPVTVKDLFDVEGTVTTAGSRVLADRPPASADAEIVSRLRRAGAVIVGKTNMTEFAYSGLGINPHYGTPRNPFERERSRIPGGSSSGAAVCVSDGMAIAAIGTDTGGSVRVPAALCGLVGFKPTAARVPMTGGIPLSHTLDSAGPLAHTVECCAIVDSILAGEPEVALQPVDIRGLRIGVAQTLVWEEAERHVVDCVRLALHRFSKAGARIVDLPLAELDDIRSVNARGGLAGAESFWWHRELLEKRSAEYDPRVRVRIEQGRTMSSSDYIDLLMARQRLQASVVRSTRDVDAWAMPTVACIAPEIAALATDEAYFAANRLTLRNAALVNFLDGCAITLPCHPAGSAPVGISLVGARGTDRRLLGIANSLAALAAQPKELQRKSTGGRNG
jgi:aspartyl-tRNA(Asn)/glutamyl-tRNA(Gln) amidotransferase subunit A